MARKRIDQVEVIGVLAEGRKVDGRRHIKLRRGERVILNDQRLIEGAVALFLDLEHDRSWEQIAEELGITTAKLKDLTKSREFMEAYDLHYAELGHDPRLRATQAAISDMLPLALRELKEMIQSASTPASTKLSAIKEIMRLAGVQEQQAAKSDRGELQEFLNKAATGGQLTINNTQFNLELPQEYKQQVGELLNEDDVVDV